MKLGDGRYELLEPIGAGGAATVYRATDHVLGVERAIKVLQNRSREELRQRMVSEARAMARLDHPNILRVYDVVLDEDVDFVVMDYAPGGSLADRLAHDGPLSPIRVLQYGIQMLSALAAAHSAGIVHRDVKPQNVLLDGQGAALLADFGIALVADDMQRGTRTGAAMGSLPFMAPEQRMDARTVGPAADIYAAGATMYALLTGRNPVDLFTAGPESARFAGVDPGMVALLRTATAYELTERYPDARAMGKDVLALLESAGSEPMRRPDPSEPTAFPVPSASLGAAEPPRRTTMVPESPSTAALDAAIGFLTDAGGTLDPTGVLPPPGAGSEEDDDGGLVYLAIPGLIALLLLLVVGGWIWSSFLAEPSVAPEPTPISAPTPAPEAAPQPAPEAAPEAGPAPAPGEVPAPEAAPAPEPAPSTPVPPGSSVVSGSWSGSLNGRPAVLSLTGAAGALGGSFDVGSGDHAVRSEVRGTYDATTRTLTLEDEGDFADAGTYTATLGPSGKKLEGTFRYRSMDRVVPFVLKKGR